MRCEEVARLLPDAVDDPAASPFPADLKAHVETCLRCQAELARYRRLLRALQLSPDQPMILNYLGYSWIDQNRNLKQGLAMQLQLFLGTYVE